MQLIQLDVEAGTAQVTLEATPDELAFGLTAERLEQALAVWRTHTSDKRLAIAAAATFRIDGHLLAPKPLGPFQWAWNWSARPGQTICFVRLVAVVRSDTSGLDTGGEAQGKLAIAQTLGWNRVLEEHETCWGRRWRDSDVTVEGDAAAQQALRFARLSSERRRQPRG